MSKQTLKVFKALSDKTRLKIVEDFLKGHYCMCDEMKSDLSKSQPTLSHHIGKLVNADVLIESKRGTNCYYKVNSTYLKTLGIDIKKLVSN